MQVLIESLHERLRLNPWARKATFVGVGAVFVLVLAVAVVRAPVAAQLAVVLAATGTAVFFARPVWALLAVFLGRVVVDLLWWIPFNVGGLNLLEVYGGGVTLLAGVLFLLEIRRVDRHPALPAFLPYVAVLAIGGLRNLEVRSAAEIIAKYMSPLLLLFLVSGFQTTRALRERWVRWTLPVFAIPVVLALGHFANGQMATYERDGYHRLIGGYEHPHNHALMMVIIAATGIWWLFQTKGWRARLPAALLAGGAAFALYMTYVRTGHLTLAIFTGSFLLLTGRRRLFLAGLVLAVIFVAVNPSMQDRFKDLILLLMPDQEVIARHKLGSGRIGIWTASIGEYLSSEPADIVLGQGIGKHWLLTRSAYNPYQIPADYNKDAHSDYLSMTFQVGPIAAISYIVIQIQTVRAGLKVRRYAAERRVREFASLVVALMIGATVANMVSNSFINRVTQSWMLWAFSGLVFAEYLQLKREGKIPDRERPSFAREQLARLRQQIHDGPRR